MSSCELLASVVPVHPISALLHIYRGAALISSSLGCLETMGDNLETKTAIAICISESPLAESSHLLCWEVTSLERVHQENSKPADPLAVGPVVGEGIQQLLLTMDFCTPFLQSFFFRPLLPPQASWFCVTLKQHGCWLQCAQNSRK